MSNTNLKSLQNLIESFERLPGIGHKTAERLAYSVLSMDQDTVKLFAKSLIDTKTKIHNCPICGIFTEDETCSICTNNDRDPNTLLIVAHSKEATALEKITQKYKYHVLNGEISMIKGITPDKLRIKELLERIENENITEIILATNPTIEGETTAQYIFNVLKDRKITISRLAYGLPMGGEIDYLDTLTIDRALAGRTKLN